MQWQQNDDTNRFVSTALSCISSKGFITFHFIAVFVGLSGGSHKSSHTKKFKS